MFDEQPVHQSTSSVPLSSPKKNAQSTPQSQKLEDIFENTNPTSVPVKPSTAPLSSNASISNTPDEPVLKTPPSVFSKKSNTPSEAIEEAMPDIVPVKPQKPLNKKNLILLIILIIFITAAVGVAIWWFTLRRPKPTSTTTNPAVLELFDNVNQDNSKKESSDSPMATKENSPKNTLVNLPTQAKDADGDGLTDEEEMILGTSLGEPDTDNDGLSDREEVKVYKTDPLKADTDNDGWTDREEIIKKQDPLVYDAGFIQKNTYINSILRFTYLPNMVLESESKQIIQFNDNISQIKLYIYINGSAPADLTPDILYNISQDDNNKLTILSSQLKEDKTPYSTDLSTNNYLATNGVSYLIRYVATKQAPDHAEKFVEILNSFEFLP